MVSWAFIFEAPETDPKVDRMVIDRGGVRTTIVGIPEPSAVTQLAVELADSGVQFIELCGGFEPSWVSKVVEATGGRVPIGTVGYAGGESIAKMVEIFTPKT